MMLKLKISGYQELEIEAENMAEFAFILNLLEEKKKSIFGLKK